jgi:hypothetical protein
VFIKRDSHGNAQKVLYGSMNFSLRGLYVQANNVALCSDPGVAGMFAGAFDLAFRTGVKAPAFKADPIAAGTRCSPRRGRSTCRNSRWPCRRTRIPTCRWGRCPGASARRPVRCCSR